MSAGKGDKPRNCFTKQYKDNHDYINWGNTIKCNNCKSNMKKNFKTCPNCGKENKVNSER
jgi:hypothetical protein